MGAGAGILSEEKHVCGSCPSCPYGGPKVGGRGNPAALIVFVAEAPGVEEIKGKIPLTGPSGNLFFKTFPKPEWWEEHGISTEDVYILNAVQCLPPRYKDDTAKTTASTARGAQVCRNRLLEEIGRYPRKLIVGMGNHAMNSLLGRHDTKITQIRGGLMKSGLASIGILPMVHPAAILRGTGNYRQFRNDLLYAFELLRGVAAKTPIAPTWQVCETIADVQVAIMDLLTYRAIACDTETAGFNWMGDEILAFGMSGDPSKVYIFKEEHMHLLEVLFARQDIKFIWHNGKFDLKFVRPWCPSARVDEDTMILSYALDESGGIHDLEQVAGDLLGAEDWKHLIKRWVPKKSDSYRLIPSGELHKYLAHDTSHTLQIWRLLREQVRADTKLETLYTKVLIPASELLFWVEHDGVEMCLNRIEANKVRLQRDIDEAYAKLQRVVRKYGMKSDVNPNSPAQVAHLLWDVIKMPRKQKANRSTKKEILDKLPAHPAVKAIREYRTASKSFSTYIEGPVKALMRDGKIHATYLIHGTRTGRLSSRKINMQNIPRDRRLRGMFYAGEGRIFVKVDLNQAELRSLAALSGDEFLCEIYRDGKRSLHKETAAAFFPGWDPKTDLGKEQLMRAKAVNFGIVYGREAPSIAEEFSIPVQEAQRYIDMWFERSPKAKAFIDRCRAAPARAATLTTIFGRKKRHWVVTRENLHAMQNEASNFPHQSIASDINILGACKARQALRDRGVLIVNLVHDEVLLNCPNDPETVRWAKGYLIECMESIPVEWGLTRIPFKAEGDQGRRWSIWQKEAA